MSQMTQITERGQIERKRTAAEAAAYQLVRRAFWLVFSVF
jgi:hypothetical protein